MFRGYLLQNLLHLAARPSGMNSSHHHHQRSENYLKRTEHLYVRNSASGLYEPAVEPPGTSPTARLFTDPRTDWKAVGVSIFISLATLGLIAVYTLTTQRLYETSVQSAIGTIQAAWAAQRSAEIAMQALASSNETTELEERAIVSVTALPDGIRMVNSGKTFAVDLQLCSFQDFTFDSEQRIEHQERPVPPVFKKCTQKDFEPRIVIPPYDQRIKQIHTNIPPQYAVFWEHGTVIYNDIFGNRHWTKYCVYTFMREGKPVTITCETGNDVDRTNKKERKP